MPNHFHGILILDNVGESLKLSPTSLTEVMRGFKTFSSRRINEVYNSDNKFKWQRSFYDRIIRNENELYKIRKYIEQNPLKWEIEKGLPENIDL